MVKELTLPFETFWEWLLLHPNCIVRAGTPDTMLYDDDDLHWLFFDEGPDMKLVQVVHGKRALGELYIRPADVSHVRVLPSEREEEHAFELVSKDEDQAPPAFGFVLFHSYDETEELPSGRVH